MDNLEITLLESKLTRLALCLFFLVVFFSFVYPVIGTDTPWHLMTGQYILTNKTIPMSSDPFSFATEKIPFMGKFILSQNWVAQILLFVIYRSLGPLGLVLTRAVVFTLTMLIMWYLIYRRKGYLASILAAGGTTFLIHIRFSDIRPQIFTFLFSAVLILLIERYRDTRSVRWLYPMPLLMLVWANMHGGFIYGVVLIFIYLFGTALELLLKGRLALPEEDLLSSRQFTLLLVLGLLSVLVSLINPNTYEAFVYTFMSQVPGYNVHKLYSEMITEYKPPYAFVRTDPTLFYGFLVCVACVLVMTAVFIRRRKPTQLLLLIFAVVPAIVSIRYIPLFLIVAAPMLARMPTVELPKPPAHLRIGLWTVAIVFFSFLAIHYNPFRSRIILRFNNSFHYPVEATNFLIKDRIRGNIFASYNTAAFINFKCYPASRIYIDSRFIDVTRIDRALEIEGQFDSSRQIVAGINKLLPAGIGSIEIAGLGQRGKKSSADDSEWKELLDKIGADIIVHEALVFRSGIIYPLVFKLARDNEWKLIYVDGTVMIFVRDEPKFKDVIAKYQLPKSLIYDEILAEGRMGAGQHGEGYYSSAALALLMKGIADNHTAFLIGRALSLEPEGLIANYSRALFLRLSHKLKDGR